MIEQEDNKKENKITKTVIDESKDITVESCDNNFLRFYDRISKRNYLLGQLQESHLLLWTKRGISNLELRIYPYGCEVDSESFKQLNQTQVIEERDRSGASKEELITTTKNKLQKRYGDSLLAIDMIWRMWENDLVISNNAENIDTIINETVGPPNYLVKLFRLKPPDTLSGAINDRRRANNLALTLINEMDRNLKQMSDLLNLYRKVLSEDINWVQETVSSHTYAEKVKEEEDIDHQ